MEDILASVVAIDPNGRPMRSDMRIDRAELSQPVEVLVDTYVRPAALALFGELVRLNNQKVAG